MTDALSPGPETPASPAGALSRFGGDPQFMQSLARGLLALGAVAQGRGTPVSPQRIAALTGLSVATVRRCLYTLGATGHVRVNRNGAVPGPALAALAIDYTASSPLVSGCGPILDALCGKLDLTVSLTMFDGDQALIVASASTQSFLKLEIPVGTVLPLQATSSGLLYLASLPEDQLSATLDRIDYRAHGPCTAMTPDAVLARLHAVREAGYAMSDQELAPGLVTVSAPVRDGRGRLLAAVSTSILSSQASPSLVSSHVVPALLAAARSLSALAP